jgi:ribonuclease D
LLNKNERKARAEHGEGQDATPEILSGYLGETPPVEKLPERRIRGERAWVERPEQLALAADALRQAQVIAIDAEFAQARPRAQSDTSSGPRLALLQLAIDGQCFVIDALRVHDLSALAGVVGNPNCSVLLHGAGADLRVMAERGLAVAHYIDLEAASRSIFGQHESSLAAMLLRAFHVRLDKSLQRTDWTRRPLPTAMIAYAARDAEMTLALYDWLQRHYAPILRLHDSANLQAPVATWIEPFLRGQSPVPPDVAVAGAIQAGTLDSQEQARRDCEAALSGVVHPMLRSRLLRLITDLGLTALAPHIEPLLQASTSDERAAAIRALGRLDGERYKEAIGALLQDPVFDVRKAAQIAVRPAEPKEPKGNRPAVMRHADGARSWTVGETREEDEGAGIADDWKARLRSIMGE